ncbi:FecR domain-containing protein [Phenylobacterium sp. LjRoot225]|uniref:FecR family protein n=1 Tax=Phenylobacterium sp. LjRoot225 TaxID=3342285 RepID=UPI003ECE3BB2
MTGSSDRSPIPDAVRERAADWHVRLGSDEAGDADWLDFESWLAEDPVHLQAYELVEQLWSDLDALAPLAASPQAPSPPPANITPLLPKPRARRTPVWMGAVAASLLAMIVIGGTFGGVSFWANRPRTETFDTAIGERRVVALADGTHITLNGGSHLTATLGRRERRVVMASAEAAFDVARDPDRPFFIEAGDREIRVVGTEFNVLHQDGDVKVTVRRGVVEVRPKGAKSAPPLARLTKGQSLTHRKGQAADAVGAADPDAALAWTTGRLVFQGEPLSEVAATLARYGRRPIEVAPDARNMRVTASLNIGSQEEMAHSLSDFLPVQVERRTDRLRLSLRR